MLQDARGLGTGPEEREHMSSLTPPLSVTHPPTNMDMHMAEGMSMQRSHAHS